MLVGELIQRIQSNYSRGVSSDDTRLSSRHIYNALLTTRMTLVTQQAKKREKISDWNYVVLPCVELIRVPSHECNCLGDLGCDIWRTRFPLPKPLTNMNKHLIDFVMSIDSGMQIDETTRQEVINSRGNKYTKDKPKYLFENQHVYLPVQKSPGILKIKYLPEDPLEASKYPSFCNDCEDCVECRDYNDLEFPIDGDLVKPLIDMVLIELSEVFSKKDEDTTNDTSDAKDRS